MAEPVATFRVGVLDFLERRQRHLLLNWAGRVGALPVFRERPSLDLPTVLDNMPVIVNDLLGLIRTTEADVFAPDISLSLPDLTAHVRNRTALKFPCAALVQEHQQLRYVLWSEIATAAPALHPDPGDILDLEHRINYTLDAMVAATVDIYSRTTDGN